MAINEVIFDGETLISLTDDTVTPETLAEGATAHDASGNVIHGVGKTTSVLYTPQVLTEAQKAQARTNVGIDEVFTANIVQNVLDNIGCPVYGFVEENMTIALKGTLPNGVYTFTYELEDGSIVTVGVKEITDGTVVIINLADPTSSEWETNKRWNSSGNKVAISESTLNGETMVITNLIDLTGVTNSTIYHFKGLNLLATTGVGYTYNRIYFYDENKAYKGYWMPSGNYVSNYVNVSDYDENVQTFTNIQQLISNIQELSGVTAKYFTIGAVLTGTVDDIVIAKDTQLI